MRKLNYETDLCVVGGGLAGLCTALAAARHGIKVVLIQDRPVLGGNASSEVRMWICGAHGKDNRETGIVEELTLENFYQNPGRKYTLWDSVLYGKAMHQENLTVLLNSSVLDAACENGEIKSVTAWQSNAETFHTVSAKYFADCSGDSILAPLTGAEFRYGREAKAEFDERIPPDVADKKTMGMSCMFQIRELDHKVEFTPPEWAYTYETDEDLPHKGHELTPTQNFWWIEVGGLWDGIHDTDKCREECLKIAFGIWDHVKNKGDHNADNWELEWIGFLPGKRESRRYVGEYTVTQNDVETEGRFEDLVAYGGWTMDDHFPEGFYYTAGGQTIFHPAPSPWGLPLRCMISKSIRNLTFAGRNVSVTHAALSSSRVMATCSLLGQALGTAIAQAFEEGVDIRKINVPKLQQTLMKDDCYLPWHRRTPSLLIADSKCSAEVVRNGMDRGEENCWKGKAGATIRYEFGKDMPVRKIYITFDSNLNRTTHNMPSRYPIVEPEYKLPQTLVKHYQVVGTDSQGKRFVIEDDKAHQRFITHDVDWKICSLELIPLETHGCEEFRVFRFEAE